DIPIHQEQDFGFLRRQLVDIRIPGVDFASLGQVERAAGERFPERMILRLAMENSSGNRCGSIGAAVSYTENLAFKLALAHMSQKGLAKKRLQREANRFFLVPSQNTNGNANRHCLVTPAENLVHHLAP